MSSNWPLKKISDVAYFRNNKRIPLKSLDRAKRQGEFPYYGASGIVDNIDDYIFDGSYLLISEDGENLRTRKTPIAFQAHGKFWVNNHAHILEEKEEGILDYLEYYFSTLDLTPYITGAVQPKLNKANLDTIEIPIPPLDERRSINRTLNHLRDKISVNTQTNQTLEQIAEAIFKSWFVDFDPVKAKIETLATGGSADDAELAAMGVISAKTLDELNSLKTSKPEVFRKLAEAASRFPEKLVESELGLIPEGWSAGTVGSITAAKGGYAFKSKQFVDEGNPVVKIKNITSTGTVSTSDCQCINDDIAETASRFKLSDGDLLMAMTGATVGKSGIYVSDGRDGYLNQRVARFESKVDSSKPCWFTYNLVNKDNIFEQIVGAAQGSAQPNISSKGIEQVKTVIPTFDLIQKYQELVEPLYAKWISNFRENSQLSELRDTLLPKLLSGGIDLTSEVVA